MNSPSTPTKAPKSAITPTVAPYEAPAIESVVTFDSLQREVLYAGTGTSPAPNPTPDPNAPPF